MMSRLLAALFLTVSVCLPESSSIDPLLVWLNRLAQQQLDDRERAIATIRTLADADRRKAMVRANHRQPLSTECTWTLSRGSRAIGQDGIRL
jgi:hypothetical protein